MSTSTQRTRRREQTQPGRGRQLGVAPCTIQCSCVNCLLDTICSFCQSMSCPDKGHLWYKSCKSAVHLYWLDANAKRL